MAFEWKLTDGTRTLDLVYSASQTDYRVRQDHIRSFETFVLEHRPDYGQDQPIRGKDRPIEGWFTMDAPGSDWDGPLDAMTTLKRWVDGEDQQALRYWTDGDVGPIKLQVRLDGVTDYTYHTIKWGYVDDSEAYYKAVADRNTWAVAIEVYLRMEPHGQGDIITLHNDLQSSPHFVEDSNSDDLADGWVKVGAGSVASLNTTNWLIGGQSQKMTTDNAGTDGIKGPLVLVTAGHTVGGYAWVYEASGDTATVALYDGADALIQAKEVNTTNADKTAMDEDSKTWLRIPVTGTNTAANAYLQIYRDTGDATQISVFSVDGCYLNDGTAAAPNGWKSTSQIYNRADVGTELMLNPGFETAGGGDPDFFANWSENAGNGTITDSATAHGGTHGCQLTAGNLADTFVRQDFVVNPGSSYELEFWARGDGTDEGRYRIYDVTNAANIVALTGTGVTAAAYSQVQHRFTAPAACIAVRIFFYCSTTDTADAYFDDAAVKAEDRINYIDTWGLPGDTNALALQKLKATAVAGHTSGDHIYVGRQQDGVYLAADRAYGFVSADEFAEWPAANWSTVVDATHIGGSYEKYLEDATPQDGYIYWRVTGSDARKLMSNNWRVFPIVGTNDTGQEITLYANFYSSVVASINMVTGDTVILDVNGYKAYDLGLFNCRDTLPDTVADTVNPHMYLRLQLGNTADTNEIYIDGMLLLSCDDEFMLWNSQTALDAGDELWIDGPNKLLTSTDYGFIEPERLGTMWHQAPGTVMNRVIYLGVNSTDIPDITDGWDVTLVVTPRTRHLLGPMETVTHAA